MVRICPSDTDNSWNSALNDASNASLASLQNTEYIGRSFSAVYSCGSGVVRVLGRSSFPLPEDARQNTPVLRFDMPGRSEHGVHLLWRGAQGTMFQPSTSYGSSGAMCQSSHRLPRMLSESVRFTDSIPGRRPAVDDPGVYHVGAVRVPDRREMGAPVVGAVLIFLKLQPG